MEKPYNEGPKIRRRLAAGYCSGSNSNRNILDNKVFVSQSNFASFTNFGSLQNDANSGCDQDLYGSNYNVLTSVSDLPKSYWTAKFDSLKTVSAILIIENQYSYTPNPYYSSWLSTYHITLGNDPDGFNNPVCIALEVIMKGGWFTCGLTGQYLSIISTT